VVLGGPPSGAASPAVAPGAAPAVTVTPAAPESPPPAPYWGGQRSLAVATAGLGLAGVVVGSVFGLEASADWSASKSDCSSKSSCTNPAGALAAHSSTVTEGAVSTTAFAVGAVGLAAGVVLWLTAPQGTTHPRQVGLGTSGVIVAPVAGAQGGGLLVSGRLP